MLCEAVYRCGVTHKQTLLGTFQRLNPKSFPSNSAFSAYVALTDGLGEIPLHLQIAGSSDGLVEADNLLIDLEFQPKFSIRSSWWKPCSTCAEFIFLAQERIFAVCVRARGT